jgi:hypothetical protein
MMMKKKPETFRSILEGTFKSLEIDAPMKIYSIWGAWEEIVGEPIALQARPSIIRKGILFMEVSHPTWVQQLQFLKPTLLEKVNSFLGEPLIEDIRFRLGKVSASKPSLSERDGWQGEDVDEKTLERIETLLQRIEDGEVREGLRDVFVKGAKLERYRERVK